MLFSEIGGKSFFIAVKELVKYNEKIMALRTLTETKNKEFGFYNVRLWAKLLMR